MRHLVYGLLGIGLMVAWSHRVVAQEPAALADSVRAECLTVLRTGLASEEFWPSMHAAEALSVSGHGVEVRQALGPRVTAEPDDQRRCGLARELVRAGQLSRVRVLVDVLNSDNPHGHVHACESLYKVYELGDPSAMRRAMRQTANAAQAIMAAGALARWGSPEALGLLRAHLAGADLQVARTAAWVLARVGGAQDLPALRSGVERADDPLTRAYFEHALAALGDPAGRQALIRNLSHADGSVRVYACEFAPEARVHEAQARLQALLKDPVLDVRIRAAHALLQLSQPGGLSQEAIVRDVYPATDANPRYSEGSLAVLSDGRLMYATTEFQGSESDFAAAQIIARESRDDGRTWEAPRVLQENVGNNNVMSVTLRRLGQPALYDDPLGFFYLVKNSKTDLQVWMRISADDGMSWSDPRRVTTSDGYHVLNNDRITVLSTGRIVVPVASTSDVGGVNHFVCSCWLSDDGQTWRQSRSQVDYPRRGAMEPEVCELADGRLLMHIRTQLGHIAVSYSSDGGDTWSAAESWSVRAPEAPSTLRVIPSTGDLLLVWNDTFRAGEGHGGRRTPLAVAISQDQGQTWTHRQEIEPDPRWTYAYTSVAFHRGRLLMTYYVRDEQSGKISSRFRSLPIRALYP
ncbi:MAG: exo-alpha-sialidase [Pirellulaceae bacterium]